MRRLLLALLFLFPVLVPAVPVMAHGVEGYTQSAVEGYCIIAQYDDGEPMSYAAVEIKAPKTDIAFQTGRTDRNGCFMFHPDGKGLWQATVQDGIGHRLVLSVEVTATENKQSAGTPTAAAANSAKASRPLKALAGLSIIFGATGLVYGWTGRRSQKRITKKKGVS